MDRVIFHCDLNAFYASVELLSYPELRRRPVAVCAVTDRNLAKLCYDRLDECGVIKHEEEMTE